MGTGAAIGAGEPLASRTGADYYSFVTPGHSRSKNGVASLAYVPGIHVLLGRETKDVDGRDVVREDGAARLVPGHDARRALRIFAVRHRLSAEIAAAALRGKKNFKIKNVSISDACAAVANQFVDRA
jgi:hypothetical protein